MPFLTQGKTNWKFLLIVVILAVIVGGGILWYIKEQIEFQDGVVQYTCSIDSDCQFYCGCGCVLKNTPGCPKPDFFCEEDPCNSCRCLNGQCLSWTEVFIEAQQKKDINICQEIENEDCKKQCLEVLTSLLQADEIADWKTYRNEEYRYELKSPQDWELHEHPIDPQHKDFTKAYDEYFCIFTVYGTQDKDFYEKGFQSIKAQGYYQEEVSIDNIPAIKFSHPKFPGHAYYAFPKEKNGKEVYFHISYGAFEIAEVTTITVEDHECGHTFNQILSTFRFLE